MKKISLKNVKETLSRKEMRVLAGGYTTGMACYSDFVCSTMFGYQYICGQWGYCKTHN